MIFHIVAMARNRVIGKDNQLPWHFSEDLKHFKALTTGHTVIMGRKTYESIGKPLPGRENFVLSRSQTGKGADDEAPKYFDDYHEALQSVKTPRAYVIGGASLYENTIQDVNGIYLTYIDDDYEGDVIYPEIPVYFKEERRWSLGDGDEANPKLTVIYYHNVRNTSL